MTKSAVKVVHVLGSLRFGGVEAWLLRLLRRMDRSRFETLFVVAELTGSEYELEALRLGAKVQRCSPTDGILKYTKTLAQIIEAELPVNVMHSHVHAFSAYALLVARMCGVPIRIAHSHTDRRTIEANAMLPRRIYNTVARAVLPFVMTNGLAVSRESAQDLFGTNGIDAGTVGVMPCGIELSEFERPLTNASLRHDLGIPCEATVIGHVGNFVPPKNHEFIIQVGAKLLNRHLDWHLAFIGQGSKLDACRELAIAEGISDRTHFLGARSDVSDILKSVVDVFLFPSLWEGLPTAVLEAQAAGLPCVLSECITNEVIAPGAWYKKLSLSAPESEWVHSIEAAATAGRYKADMSGFSIERSVEALEAMYMQKVPYLSNKQVRQTAVHTGATDYRR